MGRPSRPPKGSPFVSRRLVVQLCGLVDDDGPDKEREGAMLALAGLLTAQSQLKERIAWMIEDARAFGAYSSVKGATVYECHCTRNLLLAFVAVQDPAIATRIAEEGHLRRAPQKQGRTAGIS